MTKLLGVMAVLSGLIWAPLAQAQAVTLTWPLTSNTAAMSSQPALATGNAQVLLGGPPPTLTVWDYWSGQAQRLWAGTSGWIAGPAHPARYIQFDAIPTPGNQLSVSQLSFNHGGAGINGHIRAEVRYSVDNWSTSVALPLTPIYAHPAMNAYSTTFTAPPVSGAARFSVRILPFAILDSVAMSPTYASHNSVVMSATSAPVGNRLVPFVIRKSTGATVIPGTYVFNVTCHGPNGPVPVASPVSIVLPGPGVSTVNVPPGTICGIVESQPTTGGWLPPGITGNGLNVSLGGPWEFKVGPITSGGGSVLVSNRPRDVIGDKLVPFVIRKSTGATVIPGTYLFNLTCHGPNGPVPVPSPVAVVLPSPGMSTVNVPPGTICGIIESQPTTGNWLPPGVTGNGLNVSLGGPWEFKVGPITTGGGSVLVSNRPRDVIGEKGVSFNIRKVTGGNVVAGTYLFNLICEGPGGPYTGVNPVPVVLPSPGVSTVTVPSGSVCGITEVVPTTGSWGDPVFTGSGMALQNTGSWEAKFGPVTTGGGAIVVSNRPKDVIGDKLVPFVIRKSTGATVVPGTYVFNVTCHGPNGPVPVASPVSIVLPGPGIGTINVPPGTICGIVESQPATGNWLPPGVTGNGLNVSMGGPWEFKVGPITTGGGSVLVSNRPRDVIGDKLVPFVIRKSTGATVIPGTYVFNLTCHGPDGPFAVANPVSIVLPGTGMSTVNVPPGTICVIVESQPTTGSWSPPGITGNGLSVSMGGPWEAKVGPITSAGGSVLVSNRPKEVAAGMCPAYEFTANLNVGNRIDSRVGTALNPQTNNGTLEKFCYGDSPAKCTAYGGLYEWREAMAYGAANNSDLTGPRAQGICPAGFHIPSDMEWARYAFCLESGVAPTGPVPLAVFQNQSNWTWMGSSTPGVGPGTKMKTPHGSFSPPWTGTNTSGFGALPAGSRILTTGVFMDEGNFTAFWSATEGTTSPKGRYYALDTISSSGRIGRNMAPKEYGLSVRCMKDY